MAWEFDDCFTSRAAWRTCSSPSLSAWPLPRPFRNPPASRGLGVLARRTYQLRCRHPRIESTKILEKNSPLTRLQKIPASSRQSCASWFLAWDSFFYYEFAGYLLEPNFYRLDKWFWKIKLTSSLGAGNSIFLSIRPGRRRALSRMSIRFVAIIIWRWCKILKPRAVPTLIFWWGSKPSSWFKSSSIVLWTSESPPPLPDSIREDPIESISSMKIILGECSRAITKSSLNRKWIKFINIRGMTVPDHARTFTDEFLDELGSRNSDESTVSVMSHSSRQKRFTSSRRAVKKNTLEFTLSDG